MELKQAGDAIERDLAEAIRLDPSALVPRLMRGLILFDLGRTAEAEAELDAVQRNAPNDPLPYLGRGRMRLQQKKPAEARQQFDLALARAPGSPDIYLYRARSWSAEKQWDRGNSSLRNGPGPMAQ